MCAHIYIVSVRKSNYFSAYVLICILLAFEHYLKLSLWTNKVVVHNTEKNKTDRN